MKHSVKILIRLGKCAALSEPFLDAFDDLYLRWVHMSTGKYSDFTAYIITSMMSKNCWMSGEQCRP